MEAASAACAGVTTFKGGLRVHRRLERHVFDRIFDVEILQLGDVEISEVDVGLDQPRHDRAAARVNHLGAGGWWCVRRGSGVGDVAIGDDHNRVGDWRCPGAID